MKNLLADEWDKFIGRKTPGLERAFYAGAQSLILILRQTPQDLSEQDGIAMIEELENECKRKLS